MLTKEQVSSVVASLNGKINIPMMSEEKERSMIEQAVNTINGQLNSVVAALPDSVKDILNRMKDGVSEEEAAELKTYLVPALNEKVNIPFMGEGQEEEMLIKPVVDVIISTLRSVS